MKIANENQKKCYQCGGLIASAVSVVQDDQLFLFCVWNCKANFKDGKPRIIPATKRKRTDRKQWRPSETAIKQTIQNQLDLLHIYNLRLNSGAIKAQYTTKDGRTKTRTIHLCKSGTPDNFALPGVPLFIEVKKPDEQPTEIQTATHVEIKANGGLCFVVDDPDQIKTILTVLADHKPIIDSIKGQISVLQRIMENELKISGK